MQNKEAVYSICANVSISMDYGFDISNSLIATIDCNVIFLEHHDKGDIEVMRLNAIRLG